jgi:hypothetical protein
LFSSAVKFKHINNHRASSFEQQSGSRFRGSLFVLQSLLELSAGIVYLWNPRFLVKKQVSFLTELINLLRVNVRDPIVVELRPLLLLRCCLALNLNQTVVMTSTRAVSMVDYHTDKFVLVRFGLFV